MPALCTLILAAGTSSRLGMPKQLIRIGNKTLLEKSIEAALGAGSDKIFVVLGSSFEEISKSISHMPVRIIENTDYKEGLGSSIKTGMKSINKQDDYDAVLILMCDQLHVTSSHLHNLIKEYKSKPGSIVATAYNDTEEGVPVIFDKVYFSQLKDLTSDSGAKHIIRQNPEKKKLVRFSEATFDIDTPEDLKKAGLKL